jgi:pimeloyl-ACP methyl ester carboxylesterase
LPPIHPPHREYGPDIDLTSVESYRAAVAEMELELRRIEQDAAAAPAAEDDPTSGLLVGSVDPDSPKARHIVLFLKGAYSSSGDGTMNIVARCFPEDEATTRMFFSYRGPSNTTYTAADTVSPDLRITDHSEHLANYLRTYARSRFTLVAYSLGGLVCCQFGYRYRKDPLLDRVERAHAEGEDE